MGEEPPNLGPNGLLRLESGVLVYAAASECGVVA